MRILFLNSKHTNNEVGVTFIEKLGVYLAPYADVEVLQVSGQDPRIIFEKLITSNYDILITYNRIMVADIISIDDLAFNLFAVMNKAHICFLVDHPAICYNFIKADNPKRHTVFCSPSHHFFAKHASLGGSFSHMIWAGDPMQRDAILPHSERPYDVAVAAMWKPPGDVLDLQGKHADLADMVESVQQDLEEDPYRDPYFAVINYFSTRNIQLELKEQIALAALIAEYVRDKDRMDFIEDLIRSGFKLLLIGTGWEDYVNAKYPNHRVTFQNSVSRREILSFYQQAKVVVCPNTTNGGCERVFDGLNAGAMILAQYSPVLEQYFQETNSILFYSSKNSSSTIEELSIVLEANATEHFAKLSIDVMNAGHTWEHRAQQVAEECKLLLEHLKKTDESKAKAHLE